MPEISVIVPVYNAGKYLARCVESILAQTFTDFELILVDDGSTDNSPALAVRGKVIGEKLKIFAVGNRLLCDKAVFRRDLYLRNTAHEGIGDDTGMTADKVKKIIPPLAVFCSGRRDCPFFKK